MLRSEQIAQAINQEIKAWIQIHPKLVVAIEGYSGSGKTTVADYIAKQNHNVLVVHLDDFVHHWKVRKRIIEQAKDKSQAFEYSWYRYGDVEKLVRAFAAKRRGIMKLKTYDYDKNEFGPPKRFDLSKKVLVIEGSFLFHPELRISKLWNKTIYLDVNFVQADKRRVIREKKKWGKAYRSEDHPDNWTNYYKKAYRRYVKKFKPQDNKDIVFKV